MVQSGRLFYVKEVGPGSENSPGSSEHESGSTTMQLTAVSAHII